MSNQTTKTTQLCLHAVAGLWLCLMWNSSTASATTLNIYLLTGQSNSLGTVQDSVLTGVPAIGSAPAEKSGVGGNPNVPFWYDNFHGYNDSTDTALGASTAWSALQVQPKGPYNYNFWGPEIGFSRELYDDGNRNFAVIKVSRDGGGNTLWQSSPTAPATGTVSGAGVAYWKVVDTIKAATTPQNLTSLGYTDYKIVGLMYLQGESNSATEATAAATRLAAFVTDLQNQFPGKATGVKTVIGENLSTDSNRIYGTAGWQGTAGASSPSGVSNTNLQALADSSVSTYGWVRTDDLTIVNTDGLKIHADANSQITIGQRYADQFIRLGTATVPEPTTFALLTLPAIALLMRRRKTHVMAPTK